MKILYIDTSSSYLYSGIAEENNLICEIKKEFGHNLSEEALPAIASMFNDNNIKSTDIGKIIVVNGPGSFTGIRIGITIAKVFAWSLNIPITTITSLESMMLSSKEQCYHIPVIDARRGYVFGAVYNDKNQEILKPQHIKLDILSQKLEQISNYTFITNDELELDGNVEEYSPDILKIIKYFESKEPINPHSVNPDYLKLTEAEENNNK